MAENLPIHMSDDEEEIVHIKSDVKELSDNEEEIGYDSTSETSLDSNFNVEDDVVIRQDEHLSSCTASNHYKRRLSRRLFAKRETTKQRLSHRNCFLIKPY